MKVNSYIDHTFLSAFATKNDIIKCCEEAKKHQFFSICINGSNILHAKAHLKGNTIAICTVVGFPLGATKKKVKLFETEMALNDGADEIDMVLNIGNLKDKMYSKVQAEISQLKKLTEKRILKVIIENCYLTREEKIIACRICQDSGADFVKTSTGFGSGGATLEDVKLMAETLKGITRIKASGGIRDFETAKLFIENGAARLGTSNSVAIVESQY